MMGQGLKSVDPERESRGEDPNLVRLDMVKKLISLNYKVNTTVK